MLGIKAVPSSPLGCPGGGSVGTARAPVARRYSGDAARAAVHQIELDMQNEELRRTQAALGASESATWTSTTRPRLVIAHRQ